VDTALAGAVPLELAKKHACAPVLLTGDVLSVAFLEPEDGRAGEPLAQPTGKSIKALVITRTGIQTVWRRLYGRANILEAAPGGEGAAAGRPARPPHAPIPKELLEKPGRHPQARFGLKADEAAGVVAQQVQQLPEETRDAHEELAELTVEPDDYPVVQIVNALLMEALDLRASDIHIEPYPEFVRVRFRVDGELQKAHDLPPKTASGLVSRLKVMASLDIAEKRFPQDGRIKLARPNDSAIDFRLSTLPSIHGEKVVMRVLGTGQLKSSVKELGFHGKALQYVNEALENAFGMVLVTGPTGSGKTTTLYTMLSQLNTPDLNIVTAEDPVEYNLPDITQVSVKPQIGFTFDVALRSFLRQDPDIILVGEMRDYETAAIAVKAALTGHLVFSTVHTNDAPATVVRLVDMGIEPYLVASAVKLVLAQRLVRRICDSCKERAPLTTAMEEHLHESTKRVIEQTYRGKGCSKCRGSGYYGRTPVYEVMPIKSKELRKVITEGGTEVMVAGVAKREGLQTLKDEAIRLVNEGVTTIEEALQIILSE
jgi:type IV pilus assembly protein PilB